MRLNKDQPASHVFWADDRTVETRVSQSTTAKEY